MIDINKTIAIIKGGLLEPAKTWDANLDENRSWQETAALVSAPLIIVSAIAAAILSWIFFSHYLFAARPGFGGFFLGIDHRSLCRALSGRLHLQLLCRGVQGQA